MPMHPRPDKHPILPKSSRPAEVDERAHAHPLHHAEFLTTAADWQQLPADGAPEIAFAGRSNAGKSSALNALAQHTRLAFVSKTPGRTQNINFFRLRSGALLADLPGYGYAAVPAAVRRHWQQFLTRYLSEREPLAGLVVVMDARHALTELDRRMLEWFLPTGRPVHMLLAKVDKLSHGEQGRVLDHARGVLATDYAIYAAQTSVQLFSATRRIGLSEAEAVIQGWLTGG
jgi:GTP-binding protein